MELTLEILVDLAGDLEDGSRASEKLREKLQQNATTDDVEDLLEESLDGTDGYHNRALQDVVNNIGQRLGFDVEYGPYRPNARPRYDGLWKSTDIESDTVHLVAETKKTAGFQINPKKQPGDYMDYLVEEQGLPKEQVYGLIIVGDNGDKVDSVVDSVRGSEYRNRIRVITCDRLFKLLSMAETSDLEHGQVAQVLLPMDTVNVGSLVELIDRIVEGTAGSSGGDRIRNLWEEEAGVRRQQDGDVVFKERDFSAAERLRRVVGIAVDEGVIQRQELPYFAGGRTRCLINDEPVHPSGDEMTRGQEVRDGVFVECNLSKQQIHEKIRNIVERVE